MAKFDRAWKQSESSSPDEVDYLFLCEQNVRSIQDLAIDEKLLNKRQCRDLASKLFKTIQNIRELWKFVLQGGPSTVLFRPALENLYRDLEKAKWLVKNCGEEDWCVAAVFQIQNENDFGEILQQVGLCYKAIFEQAKSAIEKWNVIGIENLRQSSTFMPATVSDIRDDQQEIQRSLEDLASLHISVKSLLASVDPPKRVVLKQRLARYLLRRLKYASDSPFNSSLWPIAILWTEETELPGRWENDVIIGYGTSSVVFRTTWLGVPCAIKLFREGDEGSFLKEAKILAHLKHPCVIKFVCCGRNGQERGAEGFIAMELMDNNLATLIEKQRLHAHFSLPAVVDMILQIARGMRYLHDQGVAHLNLKPRNLAVNRLTYPHLEGDHFCVKLLNFRFSETGVPASGSRSIRDPVGTSRYMAPEFLVGPMYGEKDINLFKADVFSFGMTCIHILSLKIPFEDITLSGRMLQIEQLNGLKPKLPDTCPQVLVALLEDCWDIYPRSRPSFIEICTRLETLRHKILRYKTVGEQLSDSRGRKTNVAVSIFPSTRNRAQVRRLSSLSEFFYNFRVTFYILIEPLSNRLAFWTNRGRLLLGSLTEWIRIAAGNNDQPVPSRSKWRVESKDLKPGKFLGQGCSGIFSETTWSGLQSIDLLVRKDIPGVSSDVFENEAALLIGLDHLNIVKNFCWTVDKRSCTLVVEYVKDDLYTVVQKRKEALWKVASSGGPLLPKNLVNGINFPFELLDAIFIMLQIATGIGYLHDRGVFHGDLKPNNVLVDLEVGPKVVKVADFGLIESKRMATLISKHAFCYRMIEWCAPEVFEDYFGSMSEDLDYIWTRSLTESDMSTSSASYSEHSREISMEKADSYSFALTCAYVLDGKMWDANLSPSELRKQITSHGLRPELPSECPETLASLISSCWDPDPTIRPTFSVIRNKLEEIWELEVQREQEAALT